MVGRELEWVRMGSNESKRDSVKLTSKTEWLTQIVHFLVLAVRPVNASRRLEERTEITVGRIAVGQVY